MATVIGYSYLAFRLIFKLPNYFIHLYTTVEISATNSKANQIAIFLRKSNDLTSHSNNIAYL